MTPDSAHTPYMAALAARTEEALDALLEQYAGRAPQRLLSAMRYSLQSGGKRIRPVLLLSACDAVGGDGRSAMDMACALEMIHSYSLVHDDLPAMDNDTLRRGQPTCHVAFGYANAILAGDALLNLAYEVLIACCLRDAHCLPAAHVIARAAGAEGMVGGQSIDINATADTPVDIGHMDALKTGALLQAAVVAGAMLGTQDAGKLSAFARYGDVIGQLFQVTDDILDTTGQSALLGKSIGKDAAAGKATYVTLHTLQGAQRIADELLAQAVAALPDQGQYDFFRWLARWIHARER